MYSKKIERVWIGEIIMNNKNNTSFKWDRIFGVASLAAILIFAVMLYIDCGASIRSIMNIGKTTSDEVTDDGLLQNNEDNNKESNNRTINWSSKAIVCIDAPHGGSDTGQYDGTNYEKTQMLSLADSVKNELESAGVTVVMTRTTDTSVDYTKRIEICNNAKAAALVSFHRDITDKSGSSRGISAWIHTSSPSNSKSLASDIMEELNGVDVSLSGVNTGTPDNKRKDYYLNQHSKVASCIIELGNMYSSKDNKLVTTDIDNTAKLIADGIMKYLEQAGYTNGSN